MGLQIHNDIVQLNNLLFSLKIGKDKLDENQIEALAIKIISKIQEIDSQSKSGSLPLNKPLQDSIATILRKADAELSGCKTQTQKINDVRSQILKVQKTLETATIQEKLKVETTPVELKIGFFCDIETPDHNGSMSVRALQSIQQDLPFITTRSLLMGSSNTYNAITVNDRQGEIKRLLFENQGKWDIYQQHDPSGEEILVFLPKSLKPEKTGAEKLKALDFADDGSLTPISTSEIYSSTPKPENNNIDAFFRLFSSNPMISKIINLAGHGGSGYVGGLSSESYQKFLDFLESQKCRGLVVSACYSGGILSLQNIPGASGQNTTARFVEKPKDRSFTVVVRSIGDFVTYSNQQAEEDMKGFYEAFAAFVQSPQGQTIPRFRQFLMQLEGESVRKKPIENMVKVYFPHTAGIPSGFQMAGENRAYFDFNYNRLRKIEAQPFVRDKIQIDNCAMIELQPLAVKYTLRFSEFEPYVLSIIPGNSHHVIKSIELDKDSPMDFINKFKLMHENRHLSANKGYFIGSIENKGKPGNAGEKLEEVVVYAGNFGAAEIFQCLYRKEDAYYWTDGKTTKKITLLQHAVKTAQLARASLPDAEALRAASAGQDSEQNFMNGLEDLFWTTDDGRRDIIFPDKIPSIDELKQILAGAKVEDKQSLVFHLMSLGQFQLAFDVIRSEKLDVNMKDINGIPLIHSVIHSRNMDFLEYLIANGAEVNTKYYDSSVLEYAVKMGDPEIVRLLLLDPEVDVNIKNSDQNTPLKKCVSVPEILQQLVQRGALVNNINKYKTTPLSDFCFPPANLEAALTLLKLKADPNIGDPSALVLAVRTNNLELIKLFLEHGGMPFEKDTGGNVPFLEALAKGPSEIARLFLARKDCDLSVKDNNGITPPIAALFSGSNEKIQLLKSSNVPFPASLNEESLKIVRQYLLESKKSNNMEAVKELLRWNHGKCQELETCVADYFAKNKSFVDECVQEGLLFGGKPFEKNAQGIIPFAEVLTKGSPGPLLYLINRQDCNLAMDLGNGKTPFLVALSGGNREKIQILLKAHAPFPEQMTDEHATIVYDYYDKFPSFMKEDAKDLLKITRSSDMDSFILINFRDSNVSLSTLSDLKESGSLDRCVKDKGNQNIILGMILPHLSSLNTNDQLEDFVKWMIEQRPEILNEPVITNNKKMTTLFNEIVLAGHVDLIDYGLAHGAKLTSAGSKIPAPLELYVRNMYDDPDGIIYKKLVEAGADQNAIGEINSTTPFTVLVGDAPSIIDWALAHGANPNPALPNRASSPLQRAAFLDDPAVFKSLVLAGGDLKAPGGSINPPPFISIIQKGDIELIKWCIENGADPALNFEGQSTPLQAVASLQGSNTFAIFKLLVEKGADINAVGKGSHPLIDMINKGDFKGVLYCIGDGARLNTPEMQKMALKSAVMVNDPKILQLLLVNHLVEPDFFDKDILLETYKNGIVDYEKYKDSQTVKNAVKAFSDNFENLSRAVSFNRPEAAG